MAVAAAVEAVIRATQGVVTADAATVDVARAAAVVGVEAAAGENVVFDE